MKVPADPKVGQISRARGGCNLRFNYPFNLWH
jgi:hypothetical protein